MVLSRGPEMSVMDENSENVSNNVQCRFPQDLTCGYLCQARIPSRHLLGIVSKDECPKSISLNMYCVFAASNTYGECKMQKNIALQCTYLQLFFDNLTIFFWLATQPPSIHACESTHSAILILTSTEKNRFSTRKYPLEVSQNLRGSTYNENKKGETPKFADQRLFLWPAHCS